MAQDQGPVGMIKQSISEGERLVDAFSESGIKGAGKEYGNMFLENLGVPTVINAINGNEQAQGEIFTLSLVTVVARKAGGNKGVGKSTISETNKPYSKIRPSYGKGQVDVVWENAKQKNGKVYDPNTGELLNWDKTSKPRKWDMGHKPGKEYRKLHKDYMDGKISKEEFLKQYRDPQNYQPEARSPNRSRRYEEK